MVQIVERSRVGMRLGLLLKDYRKDHIFTVHIGGSESKIMKKGRDVVKSVQFCCSVETNSNTEDAVLFCSIFSRS